MASKKQRIDVHKIVGTHPVTGEPIDLKWFRGASRYNNGATIFGNKYEMRFIIASAKQSLYTQKDLKEYEDKQKG